MTRIEHPAMQRPRFTLPPEIEYPEAYARATKARIVANARKTWERTNPRALEVADFLEAATGDFLTKMRKALAEYGKLSEGQYAAVLRTIDERKAEAVRRHTAIEGGAYLGTVGERRDFTLTVRKLIRTDSFDFGVSYFMVCDCEGATVIYRGSVALVANEGDTVKVKATVKEHGQSRGQAQTLIARPKVLA